MKYLICVMYTLICSALIVANTGWANVETAGTLSQQRIALDMITDTAAELCETVDPIGPIYDKNIELSATVNAKLNNLIKNLFDVGVGLDADYKSKESQGVLQQDLAPLLEKGLACRLEVLKLLQDRLLPIRDDDSNKGQQELTMLDALLNYRYEFGWSNAPHGTVDKKYNRVPIVQVQAQGNDTVILRYSRSRGDGTLTLNLGERSLVGRWRDYEGEGEIALVFDQTYSRATGWWNYGGHTQQYNAFIRRVQ